MNAGRRLGLHALQLLALSYSAPMLFLTQRFRSQPDFAIALLIGALVGVVSIGLTVMLRRTGRSVNQSVAMSSMLVIAFWYWPTLTATGWLFIPNWLIGVSLAVLLVYVGYLYADHRYLRALLLVGSVTPVCIFLLFLTWYEFGRGELQSVEIPPTIAGVSFTASEPPDIYLLVLDAYARADILETIYDYDNTPFIDYLTDQGFTVAPQATANYSMTHYSLASLMSMDYVTRADTEVSMTDLRTLGEITRGDNPVVNHLKDHGYKIVSGGSDWWGSRCSDHADICLPTTPLDMTAFNLLAGTPIGPLLYPETGDPGTAITLQRLDEFTRWNEIRNTWGPEPAFVTIHLRLPHGPFYLDSSCNTRVRKHLRGYAVRDPVMPDASAELRHVAYVEQVECANHLTRRLLTHIPDDDIVIIIGDHGPDSGAQTQLNPASWSGPDIAERFSVLTAIRTPDDCPIAVPPDISHVNIFRLTLPCITDLDLQHLPNRHFVAPHADSDRRVHAVHFEEALKVP